jgi:peptidoglycan hydrolase-like protein with peptidoglycan-binding domain
MFDSTRRNLFVLFSFLLVTLWVGSMNVRSAPVSGDDVREVQQALRDKGHYTGPIDGILGSRTRAAIRQYQKDENLPVTGWPDANLTPREKPHSFGEAKL